MRPELRKALEGAKYGKVEVLHDIFALSRVLPFGEFNGEMRPVSRPLVNKPGYVVYVVGPEYPNEIPVEYWWSVSMRHFDKCFAGLQYGKTIARSPRWVDYLRRNGAHFIILNDSLGREVDRWPLLSVTPKEPVAKRSWWGRLIRWWR